MSDDQAQNLRPLNGVHGGTSDTLDDHARAVYGASGPSIRIESAEGITTYPGLNGDEESRAARRYIKDGLAKIASGSPAPLANAAAKPGSPRNPR